MHPVTFAQCIRRIGNDPVPGLQATVDAQRAAQVTGDMDVAQVHDVLAVDHRHLGALGPEDQHIRWHAHASSSALQWQRHFRVAAGQQCAIGIVDHELCQQGAGTAVDRAGVSLQDRARDGCWPRCSAVPAPSGAGVGYRRC
ncbi:hypothetical protein G6F40_016455 [Rhizopus arrhizus]|nr:hypothetical protein G6F40_016455 [Rhizopus arrhizus]